MIKQRVTVQNRIFFALQERPNGAASGGDLRREQEHGRERYDNQENALQ